MLRFDFQPQNGPVAPGFTGVTPADHYDTARGFGFTAAPAGAVNGTGHTWTVFSKTISVEQAIPAVVLSDATIDCVGGDEIDDGGGGRRLAGHAPGVYLLSIRNPDGKQSNLLPLTVSE